MRTIICNKKEQKLTPRYKAFVSLKEDLEIVKSLLRYIEKWKGDTAL